MCIHYYMTYYCTKCGKTSLYIPLFFVNEKCLRCRSQRVEPHYLIESLSVWFYYRRRYGSEVPPIFYVGSDYDFVIYISCVFLDQYLAEKPGNDGVSIEKFLTRFETPDKVMQIPRTHLPVLLRYFKVILVLGGVKLGAGEGGWAEGEYLAVCSNKPGGSIVFKSSNHADAG